MPRGIWDGSVAPGLDDAPAVSGHYFYKTELNKPQAIPVLLTRAAGADRGWLMDRFPTG
jgi:hypothetical protein